MANDTAEAAWSSSRLGQHRLINTDVTLFALKVIYTEQIGILNQRGDLFAFVPFACYDLQ